MCIITHETKKHICGCIVSDESRDECDDYMNIGECQDETHIYPGSSTKREICGPNCPKNQTSTKDHDEKDQDSSESAKTTAKAGYASYLIC